METIWYSNIPPGNYTTQQIIDLSDPKPSYSGAYQALKKLGVESFYPKEDFFKVSYNRRNEKIWKWLGMDYYEKINQRKRA